MKNRQSLIVFLCILGILILVGIFCYTQLEIVPTTRWEGPSREVRANQYFALDEWLNESGRPVRVLSRGNITTILTGPEQTIFVEISRLTWTDDPGRLIPWLQSGGQLIVSLDAPLNYHLTDFMQSLGIAVMDPYSENSITPETDKKPEETAADEPPEPAETAGEPAETTANEEPSEPPETAANEETAADEKPPVPQEKPGSPDLDLQTSFTITEKKPTVDRITVMNHRDKIKLVKLELGEGWIVFTGEAEFLHNYSLITYNPRREENINLAGELFFTDRPGNLPEGIAGKEGVLFVRALNGERYFFGNLVERGNPWAMAASLVLLIIVGFWMVIPPFGRFRPAPEKPGKPLRERFLAEGRFLKKYHALGKYLEVYERELEQRSRSRGIASAANGKCTENDISFKQFIKEQKDITEQLDRLNKLHRGNV